MSKETNFMQSDVRGVDFDIAELLLELCGQPQDAYIEDASYSPSMRLSMSDTADGILGRHFGLLDDAPDAQLAYKLVRHWDTELEKTYLKPQIVASSGIEVSNIRTRESVRVGSVAIIAELQPEDMDLHHSLLISILKSFSK